jgi:recombination protein RecT
MQTTAPVAQQERNITDMVLNKVKAFQSAGDLKLPKDYSPENALKAAYLLLIDQKVNGKPVLEACTKESIANALLKMVVSGLSPLKKQGDFIPYGDKLTWNEEYFGKIVLAKRFGKLKTIKGNVILEGDVFEFEVESETGRRKLLKHQQTLESLSSLEKGIDGIRGAYAIYELEDGTKDMEVMNRQQIKNAWNQGATKGGSPAHKNFADQMAIKTVISRACKILINSSDDGAIVGDENDEQPNVIQQASAQAAASENKTEIRIEDAEVVHEETPAQQSEPPKAESTGKSEGLFKDSKTADGPGF